MDLNSLNIFVKVVQRGSFSGASTFMNVPVATVSRRVSELEKELNVRLLERSTRKLRLTAAGSVLYDYAARGVEELQAGKLALDSRESEIKGTLRLSAPPNFEPWWDLIRDFQKDFPNVEVDLFVTERKVELIEDGIDVALRIGEVMQLSAVARKIYSYRHKLVATPEFIKSHGQPQKPSDLKQLRCAPWTKKQSEASWNLGEENVLLRPSIRANDYLHMRHIALNHEAITELPPFLAKDYLASGELVELLSGYPFPESIVNLVYPSRKQISRIARVYIDYCVENATDYF